MNWEKMADDFRTNEIGEGVFSDDFEDLENRGLVPRSTEVHITQLKDFLKAFSGVWKYRRSGIEWDGLLEVYNLYQGFVTESKGLTGLGKVVSDDLKEAIKDKDVARTEQAERAYEKVQNRLHNYKRLRAMADEASDETRRTRRSRGGGASSSH